MHHEHYRPVGLTVDGLVLATYEYSGRESHDAVVVAMIGINGFRMTPIEARAFAHALELCADSVDDRNGRNESS